MAEIVVKDLRKEFGDFVAVEGSNFTVSDGEFFMLLGPSGCGKTTTLRMIAGLELPTSGDILLGGENVAQKTARERDIAFVFQMFALYPHMNVYRNIAYPLTSQGMRPREVRARVNSIAQTLGITHLLKSPVGGLSGGDRQRVALGRAIVREPKAFLMDEPLGALDAEFREKMAEELRALHDRMGATTVYVTHDQLEAMQMGDKIVVMNHGVVEQWGAPQDIYDEPASLFVADFIGSPPMNILKPEGVIAQGHLPVAGAALALPDFLGPVPTTPVLLGVRPEHVRLNDAAPLRGHVLGTEYLGTTQIITIETAAGTMRVRAPSADRLSVGETVGLSLNTPTLSVFDAEDGQAIPVRRTLSRSSVAAIAGAPAHG